MKLSQHEQQILDEIEQGVQAEDPEFFASMTGSQSRRGGVVRGSVTFLSGLVAFMVGAVLAQAAPGWGVVVSLVGFLAMFWGVWLLCPGDRAFPQHWAGKRAASAARPALGQHEGPAATGDVTVTTDSEAAPLSGWRRPRRQSARSAGIQDDAAAVVGRVQPGRERPVTDLVGDRTDQREVHPADQFGVIPGQGVERTVGQGDDRGLATGFIPVGGQDGADRGDLLLCGPGRGPRVCRKAWSPRARPHSAAARRAAFPRPGCRSWWSRRWREPAAPRRGHTGVRAG